MAEDGQEALDIMRRIGQYGGPALDLVILDLNLPKVGGFDVLKAMKADDELRSIMVVVMTGSLRAEDEVRARSMGATDYCIKPATLEEMGMTIKCLRGHLEAVSHGKGKSRGSGPSTSGGTALSPLDLYDRRAPPPSIEMFIMDALKDGPLSLWK